MKKITTEQLLRSRAESGNFALISVVPEEEFIQGHIPGSDNVPATSESFLDQVSRKVPGKRTKIVLYGESSRSDLSAKAAVELERSNFVNVYHYEGGLRAWAGAGLELARGPSA